MNQRFTYNKCVITFNKEREQNILINATEMANPFEKRPVDWLRLPSTEAFLRVLSEVRKMHITQLVKTVRGNFSDETEQGTWLHEDVALEFARWLSPAFAIWCNDRVKEILIGKRRLSEQRKKYRAHVFENRYHRLRELAHDLHGTDKPYYIDLVLEDILEIYFTQTDNTLNTIIQQ